MKANGKFRADEKAVSPVIGVILMVAITVILAAIIAAFVFGMAPPAMAPQASVRGTVAQGTTFNYIVLEHQGGDTITMDEANVKILVDGTPIDAYVDTQLSTGMSMYLYHNTATNITLTTTKPTNEPNVDIVTSGESANIKIVDVASQQLIADITVRG